MSRYMCYLTTLSNAQIKQHWWQMNEYVALVELCWGENWSTGNMNGPNATAFSTNPTWTELGLNLALCGERPTCNCLSHGMAYCQHLQSKNLLLLLWKTPTCIMRLNVTLSGWYPYCIFRLSQVQISASWPATLTEVFHVFLQFLWIEAGIVPQTLHHFLLHPFQLITN